MKNILISILVVVSLILNIYLFTEINTLKENSDKMFTELNILKENSEYCGEKLNYVFEFFAASMKTLDITYEENEKFNC